MNLINKLQSDGCQLFVTHGCYFNIIFYEQGDFVYFKPDALRFFHNFDTFYVYLNYIKAMFILINIIIELQIKEAIVTKWL